MSIRELKISYGEIGLGELKWNLKSVKEANKEYNSSMTI